MLNNIFIQGMEKKYKNNSYSKISGYDVFMKKIPLTTLEYNNMLILLIYIIFQLFIIIQLDLLVLIVLEN